LSLKQLRQIAKAYNEYMLIENFNTINKVDLIKELEKHLDIIDGELSLKPHIFELIQNTKSIGGAKMSLEDEFKMDDIDHERKLKELEKSKPNHEIIKNTLYGLREITNNGLKHIEILENMLTKKKSK
jgi:hypothetical protein